MDTTTPTLATRGPDEHRPDRQNDLVRTVFARLITLDAFGHRNGRALDWNGFTDRDPHAPRLLGNGRWVT